MYHYVIKYSGILYAIIIKQLQAGNDFGFRTDLTVTVRAD
jgi:hypothetical protein